MRAIVAALLGCWIAQPAAAAPITFAFSGTVTSVLALGSGTAPGASTFAGSVTFESSTPNVSTDPTVGEYDGAVLALSVSLAGQPIVPAGASEIAVLNDGATGLSPTSDALLMTGVGPGTWGGASLPDVYVHVLLIDAEGTIFSDVSLPTQPPDLAEMEERSMFTYVEDAAGNGFEVRGSVESLVRVPEPAEGLLLALACVALPPLRPAGRRD